MNYRERYSTPVSLGFTDGIVAMCESTLKTDRHIAMHDIHCGIR
jgi:hypothetical protein